MSPYHISLARSLLYSLLAEIRKEAVPLVDAFDVPDEILNSALGRYDGDVYTHLYQWAQRAPRNRKKVCCCWSYGRPLSLTLTLSHSHSLSPLSLSPYPPPPPSLIMITGS